LSRIERDAFSWSGLRSIDIPASIEVIFEKCFASCESLVSLTFGFASTLPQIERDAFSETRLKWIALSASVKMIFEHCFFKWTSLMAYLTIKPNSQLSRIESDAFSRSELRWFEQCFAFCKSLISITIPSDSKLSGIERWAFCSNFQALSTGRNRLPQMPTLHAVLQPIWKFKRRIET
jgi:hypothetical protein